MNSGSKSVTLHLSRAQLKSLLALAYLGAWLRSVSGVARSCGMRERRPDCSRRLPGLLAPFHQERMKGE